MKYEDATALLKADPVGTVDYDRPRRGNCLRGGWKLIDLTGMRFGRWTVLGLRPKRARRGSKSFALWRCICDCGRERLVVGMDLRHGRSKSCGCLRRDNARLNAKRNTKHGHARQGKRTRVYHCWVDMRQRCNNPNHSRYSDYGGRDVGVCERWETFINFFADVGQPPRGKTLDRINVNGNYEPSNVKWSTPLEQAHNKRRHSNTWRDSDDDGENFAHDDDDGGDA